MSDDRLTREDGERYEPERLPAASTDFKRMDGPWSWIMCVLLLTSTLLQYGCVCTYGILFPEILNEFQSGRAVTAIPGSLAVANTGLLGVVIGRLCDRLGTHRTLLMGGLISATGLIASSFAPNISVLIATYGFLLGTGSCLVYVSTMVAIPLYFQKYKFEATSLVSIGPGSALLFLSTVVQHLNKAFGWRKSMLFMASFSIFPCLVARLMRSKPLTTDKNDKNVDVDVSDHDDEPTTKQSCRFGDLVYCSAFKNKTFLLATTMTMVVSLGHSMPFVHLAKFSDDIGISSDLSSWLYFVIGLCSTLSRLSVSKFGKAGLLSLPHIFLLGAITLALANLILPSVSEYYALVLYCVAFGFGEGLMLTPVFSMIMDCLPTGKRGSGFGLFQFFICISFVVGPILSGFMADVTGSYNSAFYAAGSLEIVGGSLCFFARFISSPTKDTIDIETTELVIIEKETVL